ncbi:RAMP superfamily CRISPR-associated protein [Sorangium sp. So ce426]|uniref:RAMP superfamily CRISPR-associated protein n=1 Tax=Sorangium sp. So ce426 TaxID=3133312 RepID=UPI003F5C9840
MSAFELLLRFPTGSVMIGGASEVHEGLHGAHAEDREGRPFIPATALRGALRETLEALLRGANLPACVSGTGVDPDGAEANQIQPRPCTLEDGARCKACRLFGTQRAALDRDERAFSGLILGDARAHAGADTWTLLPGVSIDRHARTAANQRFYLRRVPAPSRERAFLARGRLIFPELKQLFQSAVNGTTHIGAGRSRGLARVEMELRWLELEEEPQRAPLTLPGEGDLRLRVTLRSTASIGVPIASDDIRDTRREIPGAALRGAVGFALAENLPDPNDAAFQALVAAEHGAHFGYLYPVDDDAPGPSAPLPITAVACKHERHDHGVVDTLLDRIAVALAETAKQASDVDRTRLARCSCGAPLRGLDGMRRRRSPVPTRAVTRVSMDRARSSARDEQLFSQILLDTGTVFEGTIRNIPPETRERLALALSMPLSLGRGRSSGWGQVDVDVRAVPPLPAIETRATSFDEALRRRLKEVNLPGDRVGRLVPLTLLAPLLVHGDDDGRATILRALEASACLLTARRFNREGGWDQQKGRMEPALAVTAGGVFVVDLGPGRSWRDVLPLLTRIEQQGLGERRHQGFGHVLCFDPFLCTRTFPR